jgi:peptidyl-prolyl cis-trans isomerase A (cyclophilin A)
MPSVIPRPVTLVAGLFSIALTTIGCQGKSAASSGSPAGPAPDTFHVAFETTRGTFVVEGIRDWAPNGADRFYDLARTGFFDESRFFRVVPGYIAQFGISDDRKLNERWEDQPLTDEPRKVSNTRGTLVFTTSGPNTRSHQVFINLKDNPKLDGEGFVPFGRIVSGMAVADSLYDDYGETPKQQMIRTLGNNYLLRMFPKLDYVRTARIVTDSARSR